MRKRSVTRYTTTPEPETPYHKAGRVWDERIGSARVQARNWRLMAFGCLLLAMALAGGLVRQAARATITPYVVEVETAGAVRAVGPAIERYEPSDAQIAWHLARFIENVRSLSIDPVVVRRNWLAAYDYAIGEAARRLNAYARESDPFSRIGRQTVTVEVASVVRASPDSFDVRWIERTHETGALVGTARYAAVLTVTIAPPRTEEGLRKNPLGIHVRGLNWSRDRIAGE